MSGHEVLLVTKLLHRTDWVCQKGGQNPLLFSQRKGKYAGRWLYRVAVAPVMTGIKHYDFAMGVKELIKFPDDHHVQINKQCPCSWR